MELLNFVSANGFNIMYDIRKPHGSMPTIIAVLKNMLGYNIYVAKGRPGNIDIIANVFGEGDTVDEALSDLATNISGKALVPGITPNEQIVTIAPTLVHTEFIGKVSILIQQIKQWWDEVKDATVMGAEGEEFNEYDEPPEFVKTVQTWKKNQT